MAKAKEEMVRVRLPRPIKDEENFIIVSVNDKSWKVKKGEWVEVPRCVAEVIEHSERMRDENAAYIESVIDKV
jgi:hypothetical protein